MGGGAQLGLGALRPPMKHAHDPVTPLDTVPCARIARGVITALATVEEADGPATPQQIADGLVFALQLSPDAQVERTRAIALALRAALFRLDRQLSGLPGAPPLAPTRVEDARRQLSALIAHGTPTEVTSAANAGGLRIALARLVDAAEPLAADHDAIRGGKASDEACELRFAANMGRETLTKVERGGT